jgi:hypothetical protein
MLGYIHEEKYVFLAPPRFSAFSRMTAKPTLAVIVKKRKASVIYLN